MEAKMEQLSLEELRELAAKSAEAVRRREELPALIDDDDPDLMAALEEAIADADANPGNGIGVQEARQLVSKWTNTK